MKTKNELILQLMTKMNMSKEEAENVYDSAVRDPNAFSARARLLEQAREKEKTAGVVKGIQLRKTQATIGRNAKCPCGSKKKYKHCCITKERMVGVIVHKEKENETLNSAE